MDRKLTNVFVVLLAVVALLMVMPTFMRARSTAIIACALLTGLVFVFSCKEHLPAMALGTILLGGYPIYSPFSYGELLMIASVGIYTGEILLRARTCNLSNLRRSPMFFLGVIPVVLFILVGIHIYGLQGVLSHGGFQRSSSLRMLPSILFAVYLLSGVFNTRTFKFIPLYAVLFSLYLLSFDLLNVMSPNSAFITYYFNTRVNHEVRAALFAGGETIRLAQLSNFILTASALFISIHLVGKKKWFRSFQSIFIWLLALVLLGIFSGYRRVVIDFVTFIFILMIYHRGWKSFALILLGIFAYMGLYLADLSGLPHVVQRTLSLLPGIHVLAGSAPVLGAESFRWELWSTFFEYHFPAHPWFGRGSVPTSFGIPQYHIEYFELTQQWHSYFITALDHVGLAGVIPLIVSSIYFLIKSIRVLWNRVPLENWRMWCLIMVMVSVFKGAYTGGWTISFNLSLVLIPLFFLPREGGGDALEVSHDVSENTPLDLEKEGGGTTVKELE